MRKKLKLLLADDHAGFRQVIKTALEPLRADFVECGNGQEAIEQYSRELPDLMVMDVEMTPLDGLQATARIKARFPEACVIILTQYDDADLRAAASAAGACAYVSKEQLAGLEEVIKSVLGDTLELRASEPDSAAAQRTQDSTASETNLDVCACPINGSGLQHRTPGALI